MILVSCATGTIGRHLVPQLTAAGLPVRALTRSPERAAQLEAAGARPVVGDLADREALGPALEGVERLFLLTNATPEQVAIETGAIDAARAAGVRHVVKLAALGQAPDSPVRYARAHAEVVARLEDSGLEWTVLEPGDFMANLLARAPQVTAQGVLADALAPETRIASVDPADVAAVAARALQGEHVGERLGLTGHAVSRTELAALVGAAAGREVRVAQIAEDDLRRGLLGAGVPEWNAEGLVELNRVYASGAAGIELDTVQRVLGRPPRTWDAWLADHAEAFRATG